MKYQDFLNQLCEIDNIDYGFCIAKSYKKELANINKFDVLNSLAFAPIKYDEKKQIFNMLLDGQLSNSISLNGNIENLYDGLMDMFPMQKNAIENYIDYFYDWIEIVTQNNIDKKTINFIKKNIETSNTIFWLNLIRKLYDNSKFQETLILIKFVKKEYIQKDNYLYPRLTYFELLSLKKGYDYLNDEKIFKKICKVAKKDIYSNYEKIITFFECALVYDKQDEFQNLLIKYQHNILEWSIINILNIFELAIYTKNNNLIEQLDNLLMQKDIMAYIESKEESIYMFLRSVRFNDEQSIIFTKDKLNRYESFDFSHYEWYLDNQDAMD